MRGVAVMLALAVSATLCVTRADGAPPSGSIVFSSDRSPLLRAVHRYRIAVDGSQKRELAFVEGTLSPNGRWRAAAAGTTLHIADTRGGSVIDVEIPAESAVIRDVVWSPDSRRLAVVLLRGSYYDLWVVNRDGSRVHEVSLHARGPTWSPNSRRLAFFGYTFSDNYVSVASAGGGTPRRIVVGQDPAWAPRGDAIAYVGANGVRLVHADGKGTRLLARRPIAGPPAWSPDATRLLFVEVRPAPARLVVVGADGRGLRVSARAAVPGYLDQPHWSPNGHWIAYAASTKTGSFPQSPAVAYAEQVMAVHPDGHGRHQVTHEPPWAAFFELRWTRDSRTIVYDTSQMANDRELYSMRPDGTDVQALTDNYVDDLDPSFAPDGQSLAFVREPGRDVIPVEPGLYALDLATNAERLILTAAAKDFARQPAWSPDGNEIAFVQVVDGGAAALEVVRPDGSHVEDVIRGGSPGHPSWSPDSARIAFEDRTFGGEELFVVNRDGTGLEQVTHIGFAFAPAWSADGTKIAFVGHGTDSAVSRLWVMNVDGSSLRPLAPVSPYTNSQPAWSPDSASIVYQQATDTGTELRLVRLDGSADSVLTSSLGTNDEPDWARSR